MILPESIKKQRREFLHQFYFYRTVSTKLNDEQLFDTIKLLLDLDCFKDYNAFRGYRSHQIRTSQIKKPIDHVHCPGCGHQLNIKLF